MMTIRRSRSSRPHHNLFRCSLCQQEHPANEMRYHLYCVHAIPLERVGRRVDPLDSQRSRTRNDFIDKGAGSILATWVGKA